VEFARVRKERAKIADAGDDGRMSGRFARFVDRLFAWRDRVLRNPRFQRMAVDFPLTRPVAQKQASALFNICAGFVYSQVLAACIRLRLFSMLSESPLTVAELSERCAVPPDAMQRLVSAATSLNLLVERSGERYGLGMLGAALTGNPGIAAMVEHHTMLYDDLRDPVALLRGEGETRLSGYWPYADNGSASALDKQSISGYTALMSASQGLIAEDILAAYDFRRHRHLLDIGGGDGAFLTAAAQHAEALRLTLFDLPPVADIAEANLAACGLSARAKAIGGDFLKDPLPQGADLISLVRIILDHDDATVLTLLRACRRAIAPGGALLIAEPISGLTGSRPVTDAYFGLYLFAMGRGRPRTKGEIARLLRDAGFHRVKTIATRRPLLTNLLIAYANPAASDDNLY